MDLAEIVFNPRRGPKDMGAHPCLFFVDLDYRGRVA
jgi:hypothetical protein